MRDDDPTSAVLRLLAEAAANQRDGGERVDRYIREAHRLGVSNRQIARTAGLTHQTIANRLATIEGESK